MVDGIIQTMSKYDITDELTRKGWNYFGASAFAEYLEDLAYDLGEPMVFNVNDIDIEFACFNTRELIEQYAYILCSAWGIGTPKYIFDWVENSPAMVEELVEALRDMTTVVAVENEDCFVLCTAF